MNDRLYPDGVHVIESSVANRFDVILSTPRLVAPVEVAEIFNVAIDDAVEAAGDRGLPVFVNGEIYLEAYAATA